MRWLVIVVCLAGTARAEGRAEDFLRVAQQRARDGHCDLDILADQIRRLDPALYASAYQTDPDIRACDRKSPAAAAALSVLGSLAGIAAGSYLIAKSEVYGEHGGSGPVMELGYTAAAAAFALGPSLGRVYAGVPQGGFLYVRLAGAGILVAGTLADTTGVVGKPSDAPPFGLAFGVLFGGGTILVGTVAEWIATPLEVHEVNMTLVPIVGPHESGLAIAGRF